MLQTSNYLKTNQQDLDTYSAITKEIYVLQY